MPGPTNQNNPNVDPQESTNYELGTKWDLASNRLQLTGAIFRTENTNVIFVIDGTAVPPIFNQDDGQRITGGTIGAVGRIAPWWDVNMSVQYLDSKVKSQNPANNGKRLALAPEVSGSLWTTVRLAAQRHASAADSATRMRCSSTRPIRPRCRIHRRRRARRSADRTAPDGPAEHLQPDRPRLHPQHQQQRRPLQPGHAASVP